MLVVADDQTAPDALMAMCERAQIPMFATHEPAAFVIDVLRAYLSRHFADRASMHGVFMDILGMGVLITGESGLGKSELGLELISRGHGLVADDAVDLYRINQTSIEGRCPELLQNLLEVRGIGLLDIKAIFGETAVRRKMRLTLIVHLVRKETMERDYDRMPHEPLYQDVLGVPVRKAVIQVVAGRNIAVLVEAAVRNTILQLARHRHLPGVCGAPPPRPCRAGSDFLLPPRRLRRHPPWGQHLRPAKPVPRCSRGKGRPPPGSVSPWNLPRCWQSVLLQFAYSDKACGPAG